MEFVDPYGWHKIDSGKIRNVREKLGNLEKMTWSEILIKAKKQNHTITVDQLCADARKRLAQSQPDLEELVSLRLSGAERVWGILREGVMTVLWWDPQHQVCPSLKD